MDAIVKKRAGNNFEIVISSNNDEEDVAIVNIYNGQADMALGEDSRGHKQLIIVNYAPRGDFGARLV